MFKQKLKAALIHLSLSALLILILMGSIVFFLFPQLFISVTDFKEVASLIISIDLILGPLLTFVVFQPNKKNLMIDLSIIAAIQVLALLYGAYALYQVHPVYVTFNVDRFTIISAKDAEPEKAKYDEYKVSKLSAGTLAFAEIPTDNNQYNDLLLSAAFGGADLDQRVEYYKPYNDNIPQIIARSLDPDFVFKTKDAKMKAKKFLSSHKSNLNSFAYIPLNSLKKGAIIVLNKETAEPVTTLNIDPWELTKK